MRWALGLEYEGSAYHGWQSQKSPALPSVQSQLEQALSTIAGHAVAVVCGGRTDAGVHALGQVVHFDSTSQREARVWLTGGNHFLPADIRVRWVRPVAEDFHARYSAIARRYLYLIANQSVRPAILRHQVTWFAYPLSVDNMQIAANFLLGEHDFSAFRGADCQAKTAHRCIHHLMVRKQGNLIFIDIQANAFLHHMVRNIAGVLMEIGTGKREPRWAQQVLEGRERKLAGVTAGASGLYLAYIDYPPCWELPAVEDFAGFCVLF